MRYLLGRRASRDLDEIVRYIAKDSVTAAERWLDAIFQRFDELAAAPFVGRERDDLRIRHRSIVFGQYVILYTVQKSVVRIAHVIHGKRNLKEVLES